MFKIEITDGVLRKRKIFVLANTDSVVNRALDLWQYYERRRDTQSNNIQHNDSQQDSA